MDTATFLRIKYEVLFIGYTNADGGYNEFDIAKIQYPSKNMGRYADDYFDAWCINKDGEPEGVDRTFKIERVDFAEESDVEFDADEWSGVEFGDKYDEDEEYDDDYIDEYEW